MQLVEGEKAKPKRSTIRTPEIAEKVLKVLAETCRIDKACAAAGVSRAAIAKWRRDDPEFAEAFEEALKIGISALEDEVHRRAFEGIEKPVYHQGRQIGTIREYSDTLAIFLLKAHNPEKYRDRQDVRVSGQLDIATAILEARKRVGER